MLLGKVGEVVGVLELGGGGTLCVDWVGEWVAVGFGFCG